MSSRPLRLRSGQALGEILPLMPRFLALLEMTRQDSILTDEQLKFYRIVFGGGLQQFVRGTLLAEGTISSQDFELVHLTDSLDEAIATIRAGVAAVFTVVIKRHVRTLVL
jgi:hypothetical protein